MPFPAFAPRFRTALPHRASAPRFRTALPHRASAPRFRTALPHRASAPRFRTALPHRASAPRFRTALPHRASAPRFRTALPHRASAPRFRPHKLHADKGYDYAFCREQVRDTGITPRIARRGMRRGIESSQRLGRHRWVVERTFAWLNRFRRLKVRDERRDDIHLAFVLLGCALVTFLDVGVGSLSIRGFTQH